MGKWYSKAAYKAENGFLKQANNDLVTQNDDLAALLEVQVAEIAVLIRDKHAEKKIHDAQVQQLLMQIDDLKNLVTILEKKATPVKKAAKKSVPKKKAPAKRATKRNR